MHRLGSVLEAKEGARLVQEVVIHLASQARPWVLSLPNEHPCVASPHPRVPAFNQSPILYIIRELGLHKDSRRAPLNHFLRVCYNVQVSQQMPHSNNYTYLKIRQTTVEARCCCGSETNCNDIGRYVYIMGLGPFGCVLVWEPYECLEMK